MFETGAACEVTSVALHADRVFHVRRLPIRRSGEVTHVLSWFERVPVPDVKTDTNPKNMLPESSDVRVFNDYVAGDPVARDTFGAEMFKLMRGCKGLTPPWARSGSGRVAVSLPGGSG